MSIMVTLFLVERHEIESQASLQRAESVLGQLEADLHRVLSPALAQANGKPTELLPEARFAEIE
ncbi:hypothetical protein ABTN34_17780, partial [Acinetobacter baumannii]